MINFGRFTSHSGLQLPWKFDADALSEEDIESIAKILQWKFSFGRVYGVPRGGLRLQYALEKYVTEGSTLLIVDDVLTTGRSMIEAKERLGEHNAIGFVICARGACPDWVWPLLTVNEWAV